MGSLITLGLSQILVGEEVKDSTTPSSAFASMTKIGKTYQDTCKLAQDASEVTEHFEEGKSAPEVRKKRKKMPKLTFSIMDPDVECLKKYVGGTDVTTGGFGMDGSEVVKNVSIKVETEQGLEIYIANADVEAVINADFSAKGLFLVDFTITPCATATGGKPFIAIPKSPGK